MAVETYDVGGRIKTHGGNKGNNERKKRKRKEKNIYSERRKIISLHKRRPHTIAT
jgi:hypothetical protein